jgi:hypothetical protein
MGTLEKVVSNLQKKSITKIVVNYQGHMWW